VAGLCRLRYLCHSCLYSDAHVPRKNRRRRVPDCSEQGQEHSQQPQRFLAPVNRRRNAFGATCMSVCISVCMYVCNKITFESLIVVESLFFGCRYTLMEY